jgi:hypothetical protein
VNPWLEALPAIFFAAMESVATIIELTVDPLENIEPPDDFGIAKILAREATNTPVLKSSLVDP